jgi:hypothetical protein
MIHLSRFATVVSFWEIIVAILATSRSDIGPDFYDLVIDQLGPRLRGSDGFRGHFAGTAPDGSWTVIEVWDSAEQQASFYEEFVRPHVPEGTGPTVYSLHNAMLVSSEVAK